MKLAFLKKDQSDAENYRPVRINFTKGVCMIKCEYFNKIISKQQCGFRQDFSTNHCLLTMTEKRRKYLDKDGVTGA